VQPQQVAGGENPEVAVIDLATLEQVVDVDAQVYTGCLEVELEQ